MQTPSLTSIPKSLFPNVDINQTPFPGALNRNRRCKLLQDLGRKLEFVVLFPDVAWHGPGTAMAGHGMAVPCHIRKNTRNSSFLPKFCRSLRPILPSCQHRSLHTLPADPTTPGPVPPTNAIQPAVSLSPLCTDPNLHSSLHLRFDGLTIC